MRRRTISREAATARSRGRQPGVHAAVWFQPQRGDMERAFDVV